MTVDLNQWEEEPNGIEVPCDRDGVPTTWRCKVCKLHFDELCHQYHPLHDELGNPV